MNFEWVANFFPKYKSDAVREYIGKHGIISFIRRYLDYKLESNRNFKYNLSIVVTVKDEANYLIEFIEYYKQIGVDHFYIYNNNGTDNTPEILAPYIAQGIVTYRDFPGQKIQTDIYADAVNRYRPETKWMAIVDIDEFILPLCDSSLTEFLVRYEQYPQICIHWILFGSAGHRRRTNDLVIERFNRRATTGNPHVKSIVNPRAVIKCKIHFHFVFGKSVNADYSEITGPLDSRAPIDQIRINHYVIKSWQEYMAKQKRGRASGKDADLSTDFFRAHDQNDVIDNSMQKHAEYIKNILAKRR